MMKPGPITLTLIILLASVDAVPAQSTEVRFLIDTCITIIKKNAINPHHANMEDLEKNALAKASGITDPSMLGPAMRYIYERLDDFHGAFKYKDSTFRWPHKMTIPDSVMNDWKNGTVRVKTRILHGQIGYLVVPGMNFSTPEDANKKAQQLNDSLCHLLSKNIKGLIIDVRENGGGTMFPMILGVEALLGEGSVGSFPGRVNQQWIIRDHKFSLDTIVNASLQIACIMNGQNLPVVILTGPATRSSGEFFLMTFKGRQKTILLGAPTAGYITSVAEFPINDNAYMLLSTGYGADRNGTIYRGPLQPDVFFDGVDNFNNIEKDEKVKAAIQWLEKEL